MAEHIQRVGVARVAGGEKRDAIAVGEPQADPSAALRAQSTPLASRMSVAMLVRLPAPREEASRPDAPSGSSSCELSGSTTFMTDDKLTTSGRNNGRKEVAV